MRIALTPGLTRNTNEFATKVVSAFVAVDKRLSALEGGSSGGGVVTGAGFELLARRGQANGYCPLNSSARIDLAYLGSNAGSNRILGVNLAGTAAEFKTLQGTTNRVTVSHFGTLITLSGPQDIHTSASPTFADLTLSGSTLTMANATTNTKGVVIGTGRFYQGTAPSGSGATNVNAVIWTKDSDLYLNCPVHTHTSASEVGLTVVKTYTPAANTSGRLRGLNFTVTGTGSFDFTDATGGLTGVQGIVDFQGTGTATAIVGGIFYTLNQSTGTVTKAANLLLIPHQCTGGGTTTEAISVDGSTARVTSGTVVTSSVFKASAATVTATLTNVYHFYSNNFNAFTANSQIRVGLRLVTTPDPGAFTGCTSIPLLFDTTTTGTRSSIAWRNGTAGAIGSNLYPSATNVLKTDQAFHVGGAFSHLGTTLGLYGATPVVQSTGWSVSNLTTDKSYDANATTLDEVADVLGTLITDLISVGILGA